MLKRFLTACALAAGFVLFCSPVMAQDPTADQTTVESRADQPTDASAQATDQPPPVVRKVRNFIQTSPIVQKLKGDGFYPRIGGLSQGSGARSRAPA